MPDLGHELLLGTFITPTNQAPQQAVALAQLTERAGLDLVTFQDHPYQAAYHDTWTLLSYVAARTDKVRLAGNVLNLPLRQPAVLARAAAGLDRLTGGRVEMGLGAGAFWDAIESMGGTRLTPGQAVDALEEAIEIMRRIWDPSVASGVTFRGIYHKTRGTKRGPAPAHAIEIWLGAYKPRMLRLTGRLGDGWLPSWSYLGDDPIGTIRAANAAIDDAAREAGREPSEIRRLVNLNGRFSLARTGFLQGPSRQWVEELAELTLEHGFSGLILAADDPDVIERFGAEVAPALRELVADARRTSRGPGAETPVPVIRTAPDRSGRNRRIAPAKPDADLATSIDLAALPARLRERAYTPRDAGYDDVRSTYMVDGHPGLVLMARCAGDVVAAVEYARTQPVPLSIRSGGHGLTLRSTNDGGIVLDLSALDRIEVLDPTTRRVRLGAGATWGHVADALGEHGWAMTSGNNGDVGVGGIATAGGIGYLLRRYGLTIDHMVAADLVLADGSEVRVDADHDPELFWGLRGAGGNLGVVTAVEMTALPVADVLHAAFTYDITDTVGVLTRWSDVMVGAPRELTSFLYLQAGRPGQPPVAQAVNVWAGDDVDSALPTLERLLRVAPLVGQEAAVVPYRAVVPPLDSRHRGQQSARSRNGFLPAMTADAARVIRELIDTRGVGLIEVRALGGAFADIDSMATAFAHRRQGVFVSAGAGRYAEATVADLWSAFEPQLDGLYAAYTSDTSPQQVRRAYPGPTLERLLSLKRGNLDITLGAPATQPATPG
jgi:alkanesulfonate monooxygenase SsuD/methylene tetrahydromethanopterin reductase-like flavin-dependent oxidoreductase (luciferase family)